MISSALFVMRSSLVFYLSNLRFHGFYQLCELFLAFLSCLCVDILGYAFAVDSHLIPWQVSKRASQSSFIDTSPQIIIFIVAPHIVRLDIFAFLSEYFNHSTVGYRELGYTTQKCTASLFFTVNIIKLIGTVLIRLYICVALAC